MKYTFIQSDWFHHSIPVWTEKLAGLAGHPDLRAIEVGSFEGRSAIWMLENVLTDPTSHLTCIDAFVIDDEFQKIRERMQLELPNDLPLEARFDANIHASGAQARVTKLKGASAAMLRTLPLDSFDLMYIDGSHTTRNVLTDAVLGWDLLKLGGIMIFDDYLWNVFPEDPLRGPQKGIDAFLQCFDGEYEIMHKEYQVILRKTKCIRTEPDTPPFTNDL